MANPFKLCYDPPMRIRHSASQAGRKIVIVVGGGFAGLNCAKSLANKKEVHVVLVDQRNHHLFQPLLYQVATAGLNPGDIAVPIRSQFAGVENVEVHLARADAVDLQQQIVVNHIGSEKIELEYDYLVLACGAHHSYFAHHEWEKFAPGLKTLEQATEIRRRILLAFEQAENELDPEKQKSLLNFVVVGGGPTGVELAGAIADISRTVLIGDFRRIDPSKARVILVEAGPRVLTSFDEKLSAKAEKDLRELGVEVRINARVEHIDANGVQIGRDHIISKNVFWAAGVQAAKLQFHPQVQTDRAGRVVVEKDFSIPQFQNAFVLGDMAAFEYEPGRPLPGLAPVAIQSGEHVGKVILSDLHNRPRPAFRYVDKGQMATIGKNKAVAQSGPLRLNGRLAWLAWLFVHVFYLIGFKNRISVMAQWAWSYLFSKRGSRLITDQNWQMPS